MSPSAKLKEAGWYQVGARGYAKFWDHALHRPDRHGVFTTTSALEHQLELERDGWCDCFSAREKEEYSSKP